MATAEAHQETYEQHRAELMVPAVQRVATAAAVMAVLYGFADILVDGFQVEDALFYGTLLAISAAGSLAAARVPPRRLGHWMFALDLAFSLVQLTRLAVPTTSSSGTVLFYSLKMLALGLVLPWSRRLHAVSIAVALVACALALALRNVVMDVPVEVHHLVGPPLAGLLSWFGGAALERTRRQLHERTEHLAASETRLRSLPAEREADAGVAEALARVGRVVVGAINKPGLLERLAEVSARVLDADFGHVLLHDPADDAYFVAAGWGDPADQWEAIRMMRFPRAALPRVHETLDETGLFQSGPDFARPLLPPDLQRSVGVTLAMVVQLRHEGVPLGLVAVGFRGRREPFSAQQQRIARGVARVASLGLANASLFDELERAHRIKDDFVASMSHELRTPLNVILGYQALLLDGEFGPLSAEQAETLARVQASSVQLLDMVSAILDLSRLEADRVETAMAPIDVGAFFAELRALPIDAAGDAAVAIEWHVAPGLPPLISDVAKLRVVVRNLLANAVKFGGGGTVRVTARGDDDGVEISVADEGIGIAPEVLEAIFEPFRQADASIAARFGGVGLGLHIARRLVDVLGGTITVASQPGHGATFSVRLPLAPLPAVVPAYAG